MPNKTVYLLLGAVLALAIFSAIRLIPFSYSEGDFALNVLDCLRTGHVSSTFLPDFYPFLCTFFYKPFGPVGIIGLQSAMYLGVGALTFQTILQLSSHARGSAIMTTLILLDPDLLLSIPKLWDTEITVLFLSALLSMSFAVRQRSNLSLWLLGITWGLSLSVRPNFALLAFPLGYALWLGYGRAAPRRAALAASLAFATLFAASTAAHGSFYLPQNGPYNFFAGANPHTQFALTHSLNAEPSIAPAMADHGYPAMYFYALSLRPTYTSLAMSYLHAHPFRWAWLGLVKLATLLRPDTKAHALWTAAGLVKLLTSLSIPVWLLLLARTRPLRDVDKLFVIFAAAYVLPFMLTNADPRFRPPLDVLALTHAAVLVLRRWEARKNGNVVYGRGAKYPVLERT